MPKQPAIPGLRDAMKKKLTRREVRTSLPGHQAPVRSCEDPLSGVGQEPGASVHTVRARQPVPSATTVAGMRTSLSEIRIDAAQATQTERKSLETVPIYPNSASSGNIGSAEAVDQTFPNVKIRPPWDPFSPNEITDSMTRTLTKALLACIWPDHCTRPIEPLPFIFRCIARLRSTVSRMERNELRHRTAIRPPPGLGTRRRGCAE